jgi:hypothetical protein
VAETIGSLADKISIFELKIFHMSRQTEREDVTPEFRESCSRKLEVLEAQRDALVAEVTALTADIVSGRVRPIVFRQFKMYNDPKYR